MKGKIFSLTVIVIFIFSVNTYAQPGNRESRKERNEMFAKRPQQFKNQRESFFTEEQKEAMKQMRLETAQKVKTLKNELRELHARQQTLTTADNADIKDIHKNIEKISGVKTEIAKIHATQHQEIRKMLTEEQLLKFDQRKNSRKKQMPHRPMRRNFEPERIRGRG